MPTTITGIRIVLAWGVGVAGGEGEASALVCGVTVGSVEDGPVAEGSGGEVAATVRAGKRCLQISNTVRSRFLLQSLGGELTFSTSSTGAQ